MEESLKIFGKYLDNKNIQCNERAKKSLVSNLQNNKELVQEFVDFLGTWKTDNVRLNKFGIFLKLIPNAIVRLISWLKILTVRGSVIKSENQLSKWLALATIGGFMSKSAGLVEKKFEEDMNSKDSAKLFDQYKQCISSAEEISKQRASSNSFFLTVNAALVAACFLLPKENFAVLSFACLLCIVLTFIWRAKINSYKRLNGSKFTFINIMEKRLSAMPYSYEWDHLSLKQHTLLTNIEGMLTWLFVFAYGFVWTFRAIQELSQSSLGGFIQDGLYQLIKNLTPHLAACS